MNDYVTDNKIETFYALEDFISKKNVQGVSEIVRAGFDINCVPPSHHLSPLSFACMLRNAEIARLLLDYGADANISGSKGETPLWLLCNSKIAGSPTEQIAELLVSHGADVDTTDAMGKTPVLLACEDEDYKLVHLLCSSGCNVNISDINGDSPIKEACKNAELWFFLHCRSETINNNISINHTYQFDPNLYPPIIIAKELLCSGADPHEATLLPAAVNAGAVDVIVEFLQLGMDVNMLDNNQRTALGCACTLAKVPPSIVRLLLEHGADVNKGGGWRKHKPLIFAYVHNSVQKIRLLLSYGARLSADEMSELVSITLSKFILENPEVVNPSSRELMSWQLLLKTGTRAPVQGSLASKVHQLSMCSSYCLIGPWIQTLLYPLLSLQDHCRIAIRASLQPSVDDNVKRLGLPRQLENFCMFTEFS